MAASCRHRIWPTMPIPCWRKFALYGYQGLTCLESFGSWWPWDVAGSKISVARLRKCGEESASALELLLSKILKSDWNTWPRVTSYKSLEFYWDICPHYPGQGNQVLDEYGRVKIFFWFTQTVNKVNSTLAWIPSYPCQSSIVSSPRSGTGIRRPGAARLAPAGQGILHTWIFQDATTSLD